MAKVYVGTYAKYNSGSIAGAWLDLEDFADHEAFMLAARELHANESDPELMFQDFEDFPRKFYGESHIDAALWDWLELDEDDRAMVCAYWEHVNEDGDIDEAREACSGTANSEIDFAQNFAEEIGAIPKDLAWPCSCIDWEQAARELMYDYCSARADNGTLYFFRR